MRLRPSQQTQSQISSILDFLACDARSVPATGTAPVTPSSSSVACVIVTLPLEKFWAGNDLLKPNVHTMRTEICKATDTSAERVKAHVIHKMI